MGRLFKLALFWGAGGTGYTVGVSEEMNQNEPGI